MPDVTGNTDALTYVNANGITETILTTNSVIGGEVSGLVTGGNFSTDPSILASKWRANGIPDGAEPIYDYTETTAQFKEPSPSNDWRVKISCDFIYKNSQILSPLVETGGMIFPYLPQITISHSANYQQLDITHINYPFYAYKNSQADEISITGKFTVQNAREAAYWVAAVHFLRTVTKMFFGQGDNLGNPPPICSLKGYGDFVFKDVSCIIKSFNVTLPNDVDYIESTGASSGEGANYDLAVPSSGGRSSTYVPVSSDITVILQPVYSREKIKTFNLTKFANGDLILGNDGKGFI